MSQESWTILKLLNWTQEFFEKKNIDGARLDAEILLARVLQCERIFLYVNFEKPLTKAELASYKELIIKRARGQSIAYILGEKQFMHFILKVNEHVLVPRPETELLVEQVLGHCAEDNAEILDLCTGSGAIGVALAKYRPTWKITGTDISLEALAVAQENARIHAVEEQLEFVHSDMFAKIPEKKYRAIVANPPYIPCGEKSKLAPEVLCEPHLALFAREDGLQFYRIIAQEADKYLMPAGEIFLECGVGQANRIKKLFETKGYRKIDIFKDYAGIERILTIGLEGCVEKYL